MFKFGKGDKIKHNTKGHVLTVKDISKTGKDTYSYDFEETNLALATKNEYLYSKVQ